jgi:hypothetical protein
VTETETETETDKNGMTQPRQIGMRRAPLRAIVKATIGLELFLSIGALAGGLALMIGPRGEIIPLPIASLAGSPFDIYFVPGAILFGVLGIGPLVAARLAWIRQPLAPWAALLSGLGLLIWLAVEIAIVGYTSNPPLQPIYLVLGLAIAAAASSWLTSPASVVGQE